MKKHNRTIRTGVILTAMMIISAGILTAGNNPGLIIDDSSLSIEYSSSQAVEIPVSLTVNDLDTLKFPGCILITVESPNLKEDDNRYLTSDAGTHLLQYHIFDNMISTNELLSLARAEELSSSNDVRQWEHAIVFQPPNKGGNDSETFTFTIAIPAGQDLPSGDYTDNLKISLYTTKNPSGNHIFTRTDTKYIQLTDTVPHLASMLLGDVGASYAQGQTNYSVDFGVLECGKEEKFDLIVQATSGFEIFMESKYGGKLKHEDFTEYCSYGLCIDHCTGPISLDAGIPVKIIDELQAPANNETSYTVVMEVLSHDWLPSGNYRDNLTFTIESN